MDSMAAVGDPAGHVWGNWHWCRAGRWDQKGAGSGDLGRELGAATPVRAADGPPFLLGVEDDESTHGSGGRVKAEVVARRERTGLQRRGGRDGHPVAGTVGGWRRLRDAPRGAAAQPIDGGCVSKSLDRSVVAAVSADRGMGMRHAGEGSCRKSKPTSRRGRSLLTRAKGKAGGVEEEEVKISKRERARQPGRVKDRGHHRLTRVRPLCLCHVHWGRHAMAGPERMATGNIARMVYFGAYRDSRVNLPRPAVVAAPKLWSFPAPLLVSEGSHPALAARGCKMLLPGFSTTLCPAPSLLPPNIPDVRSMGAWIGGVSRDTERPPARSLPDAGPCQLPALTTFHSCGFRGTTAVSKMAATSRPPAPKPNQHQQQGPAGQVPGSSKDGNCLALGLECPESTSPLPLPRTLHACQFV